MAEWIYEYNPKGGEIKNEGQWNLYTRSRNFPEDWKLIAKLTVEGKFGHRSSYYGTPVTYG